jgi:hypothetical protein
MTDEIVKGLEGIKQVDKFYQESGYRERFRSIQYVDREEDAELKAMFEQEVKEIKDLDEKLKGKVDAVIDMDLHGNM